MASQGTTTSRLAQIQMRFQQKQLQEREQRKMEMTASKIKVPEIINNEPTTNLTAKSTTTKNLNSSIGNGKVRQMFNERRRGAGIDRSNPLKPITSRSSSSSSTLTTVSVSTKNVEHSLSRRQEITALRPINGRKMDKSEHNKVITQKVNAVNNSLDYSNDENTHISHKHETYHADDDDLDSESFPDQQLDSSDNFDIMLPSAIDALDLNKPSSRHENSNDNSTPANKTGFSASIKLNPVLTKKFPPAVVAKVSGKSIQPKLSSTNKTSQANSPVNVTQKPTSAKPKAAVKGSPKMAKPMTNSSFASKRLNSTSHPPGTVPCSICERYFNHDRISKHEEVCEKMSMKKRKIFDASKHRVKGTEAEKFLKKPMRGTRAVVTKSLSVTNTCSTDGAKKSNWRKKHEEFIAAIRAAKEVQAHLAKGGKLSDLPPPPPSENLDYITCPHCSRRFNEAAANRHIPKCALMIHNKPKLIPRRK